LRHDFWGGVRTAFGEVGLSIAWRAAAAAILLAVAMFHTGPAFANCEVTETGIPEDAVAAIDPGGLRRGLAKSGIGMGGAYYGEFFANSGGVHQGGEYDGALYLYLNADMQKLGLWKGLCFHVDGFQIHGVTSPPPISAV
jgi:porin